MKKYLLLKFVFIAATFITANAQMPYYYNNDGTHNTLNDLNWDVTTLKLNEEFSSETATKTRWRYHWDSRVRKKNSDQFYLTDDVLWDNFWDATTSGVPYNFANNHNHTYTNNTSTGTVILSSRLEPSPLQLYYRDGSSTWGCVRQDMSITTGLLITQSAYKYGYFEARFKINRPVGNDSKGFGQCFWLMADYSANTPPAGAPNGQRGYCEIDIAENDPYRGLMTSNYYYRPLPTTPDNQTETETKVGKCTWDSNALIETVSHSDEYIAQTEWHTYALEWTPYEMNTYYDNKLVRHMEYPADQFDYMNIFLDIEGAKKAAGEKYRWCEDIDITGVTTKFPFNFEIDYVKVYKLKTEGCTIPFERTNYNFGTQGYAYGLKKHIELGQHNSTTASVLVNNGQNVSLRAVDYVLLDDGFEVTDEEGTEFFATTNGTCEN
jgi:hypothetical protein